MHRPIRPASPRIWPAIRRGVLGRCPNCGRGRLFASYLKQVERCEACAEPYGHLRADDGPPWLTILVVGHLVVPAALALDGWMGWPDWAVMALWPSVALVLVLLVLPRAKGVFLGIIWATRAPGSETA